MPLSQASPHPRRNRPFGRWPLLTLFIVVGLTSQAHAVLQLQNLQVPGFICPGQPVTISFQAQVDASNVQPQMAAVFSPVSASSFSAATDYLFLYSAGQGATALAPGWFKLDNAFTLVPAGNLSMVTYTWWTIVPSTFTTGQVIYVNLSGGEISDWATNMNMTTDPHLSQAVTVSCTSKLLTNIGQFGGTNSSASLVIQQCASTPTNTSTNTATRTATNTATRTCTQTPTNTATNSPTFSPTRTPTNTATNTIVNTATNTATNTVTQTPTNTATRTATNTATNTSTLTATNTVTNTATNTVVNTATNTSTNTPTRTPTNTATNTVPNSPTNTATDTATNTVTRTPTNTSTLTATNTATNTPTITSTNTATNTFTETGVNTSTNTATDTVTPTLTNTATLTATNTATHTPTLTATPSATDTPTDTVVNTPTQTPTDTPTRTSTGTPTDTVISTATNTPTDTAAATSTDTATITSTMTATNSATNTATLTSTGTATQTATTTPTSFIGLGKSASKTNPDPGDTLTYTIAVTIAGGTQTGVTVTDVLPPYLSFLTFGSSPFGTATSFNAPTSLLQWILPSPLSAGSYQLTYQAKTDPFAPAGVPIINNAQLTCPALGAPITTTAPITITGDYTVSIKIYNAAGEVVKTVSIQRFTAPVANITLQPDNIITTLKGPGGSILIYYAGALIGTWDGTNDSNDPVTNGAYMIKIDSVGTGGDETTVSQQVTVSRSLANVTVDIYNSSGEVVRKLYALVDDTKGSQMTDLVLSSGVLKTTGGGTLQLYIQTSSGPMTLTWDGASDAGNLVTSGEYQIEIHWDDGQGTTNIVKSVLVAPPTGTSGRAIIAPNVLSSGTQMTTLIDATGVSNADSIHVSIYTMAGELVTTLQSASGSPQVNWDATGHASGLYIAVMDIRGSNGGTLSVQRQKFLILR